VTLAGGIDNSGNTLGSAEVFSPANGQFVATGTMVVARSSAGAATTAR